ncbi:MAG: GvpL/GvpF family gas vesicle protein [Candidatus Rokubacteria bacterium]|nr:GvpL/GvpF family gas vesicle protein [Candidatus Rokubacteria bacterium]
MSLHLYAVCAKRPRALARRRGAVGEPLRAVPAGALVAVVGEVEGPPPLDPPTLRAHDAVVRALAQSVDALLPVRFGTIAADEAQVAAMVAERRDALAGALELVAGREQMTLRVFGTAPERTAPAPARARGGGAGTRYLTARRAADRRARAVPEIAWLRPALRRFVQAERVERHRTPPLVATVHHLIRRGQAPAYLAVIERAARTARPVRVVASGPAPPWAFTGDADGAP